MKFNKELAIILILLSLLISAVAVSFYFYKKNQDIVKSKNEMVTIYVAKKELKRNTLITEEHLKSTKIARQYILNKPLLQKEILGKYAKETIFVNEIFIKQKLSTKVNVGIDEALVPFEYNSYNMAFKLFKNPNYSLKPKDYINIVSVYPKNIKKFKSNESLDFNVRYVAKDIKVLGFLRDGRTSLKSIVKKKVKKVVKKKQITKVVEVKADELIIDIQDRVLLTLIDDYNKGKQLWIVKTNKSKPQKLIVKKTHKKIKKKRAYPITWYKVKNTKKVRKATIEYKDKPDLKETKKATVVKNYEQMCTQTNKLLLGISKRVYLKEAPHVRAKTKKRVYKNYVIPYTNILDNKLWYRTCDGLYVHKNEVKAISYNSLQKYMKKNKQ